MNAETGKLRGSARENSDCRALDAVSDGRGEDLAAYRCEEHTPSVTRADLALAISNQVRSPAQSELAFDTVSPAGHSLSYPARSPIVDTSSLSSGWLASVPTLAATAA